MVACLFIVFKPIFASAKMCINPNAELELKTPKAKLHLEVQNIAIEMTKPQVTWETQVRVRWDCQKQLGNTTRVSQVRQSETVRWNREGQSGETVKRQPGETVRDIQRTARDRDSESQRQSGVTDRDRESETVRWDYQRQPETEGQKQPGKTDSQVRQPETARCDRQRQPETESQRQPCETARVRDSQVRQRETVSCGPCFVLPSCRPLCCLVVSCVVVPCLVVPCPVVPCVVALELLSCDPPCCGPLCNINPILCSTWPCWSFWSPSTAWWRTPPTGSSGLMSPSTPTPNSGKFTRCQC